MKLRVITTENPPESFEAPKVVVLLDHQGTLTVRCFTADGSELVQEARFAPSAWQSYRLDGEAS